jgi:hypothetical protein
MQPPGLSDFALVARRVASIAFGIVAVLGAVAAWIAVVPLVEAARGISERVRGRQSTPARALALWPDGRVRLELD